MTEKLIGRAAILRYSPWPFRLALALALTTFPLIWVGGLVTTYDAGMAVPDWPSTYGYNLLLYPWQTWIAGPWDLFIEHGHRLLGAAAGLFTIGLVAAVWMYDSRRWLLYAALGALALVVAQGVLGGARVLLDQRLVALVHGCVGPLFFAYVASVVVFTSRTWRGASPQRDDLHGARLSRAGWIFAASAYVQLVLGAVLRHFPLDAPPALFRAIVLLHLVVAAVLLLHALLLVAATWSRSAGPARSFRGLACGLASLVLIQMLLGGATWVVKFSWPDWLGGYDFAARYVVHEKSLVQSLIVTAHVANGSLILALAAVQAWLLSRRFFRFPVAASAPEVRFLGAAT